jgi:hypothetical protein
VKEPRANVQHLASPWGEGQLGDGLPLPLPPIGRVSGGGGASLTNRIRAPPIPAQGEMQQGRQVFMYSGCALSTFT